MCVWVYVCVYISIYIHIYIHIHIHIQIYTLIHSYMCIRVSTHIFMCILTHFWCVDVYMHMSTCIHYVYMYILASPFAMKMHIYI